MFKFLQPGQLSLPLVSNVIFDILLVFGTIGGAWLWVRDPIDKISFVLMIAMANSVALILFYRPPKGFLKDQYKQWALSFAVSSGIAAAFMSLEPVWWNSAVLFVKGNQEQASILLNSQPHANLPMFIGLWGAYGSLVGLFKLTIKRACQ